MKIRLREIEGFMPNRFKIRLIKVFLNGENFEKMKLIEMNWNNEINRIESKKN